MPFFNHIIPRGKRDFSKITGDVIQAIAFSMLNFKACGTPLNIMQSSKYIAHNFFIMIGTTSKGGTVKLVTFIFPPLAKGHPNMYVYVCMYMYACICMHVYVCMYMCICMCVCVCMCVYMCMYVCIT